MARVPELVPVSELRQDVAAVMKRLRTSKRPFFITQRGHATGVLIGVAAYERAEREREILQLLARGEQEIAAGVGSDLEDVLAEASALLDEPVP